MTYSKLTIASLFALVLSIFGLPQSVAAAASPSLRFDPTYIATPANTRFTVDVIVDPAGYSAGGAGAVITYSPQLFEAISVTPTDLFADYPIASIDDANGIIKVSGVAGSPAQLVTTAGSMARLTFVSLAPGVTSTIEFKYVPNSTTDSNIAASVGNGDILASVTNLKVATSNTTNLPDNSVGSSAKTNYTNLSDKLRGIFTSLASNFNYLVYRRDNGVVRSGRIATVPFDPQAPLTAQTPISDPSSYQPSTNIITAQTQSINTMTYFLIAVIVLLFGIIIYLARRRAKSDLYLTKNR